MEYVRTAADFNADNISVETYDGLDMDFSSVQGANDEWYIDQKQELD